MNELADIKNIVFDFGGILVDLDRERCISAFENLGVNVRDALGQYTQSGVFSSYEKGDISTEEFCDALRQIAGRPEIADRKITDAWDEFLVGIPSERLDCLAALRDRYKLYLLSNTNRCHWTLATNDLFLYHGLTVDYYFEKIYLSYKMGMLKPESAIFEAAIKDAGIKPAETLFIDDSEANCQTAAKLGLRTFHSTAPGDWMKLFQQEDQQDAAAH